MSNPRFAYPIGMRVRLASGGPVMTVTDVDPLGGRTECSWQDDQGGESFCWFPSVCLDIVRNEQLIDR